MSERIVRTPPPHHDRAGLAAAWFGLLGGAIAWSVQLVLGDAFAEVGCEAGGFGGISIVLLAITGAAVIVAAAALLVSLAHLRRLRRAETSEPSATRARFMATSGAVASGIFLTLIVMGGVLPHLFLATCEV
jgi:hypothetical protein